MRLGLSIRLDTNLKWGVSVKDISCPLKHTNIPLSGHFPILFQAYIEILTSQDGLLFFAIVLQ